MKAQLTRLKVHYLVGKKKQNFDIVVRSWGFATHAVFDVILHSNSFIEQRFNISNSVHKNFLLFTVQDLTLHSTKSKTQRKRWVCLRRKCNKNCINSPGFLLQRNLRICLFYGRSGNRHTVAACFAWNVWQSFGQQFAPKYEASEAHSRRSSPTENNKLQTWQNFSPPIPSQ